MDLVIRADFSMEDQGPSSAVSIFLYFLRPIEHNEQAGALVEKCMYPLCGEF